MSMNIKFNPEEGKQNVVLHSTTLPQANGDYYGRVEHAETIGMTTIIANIAAALQTRVGSVRHVLVEERIDGEDLAIGRADLNAPDVDGAIVVVGGSLQAGDRLEVRISAVRGVDLEAVPLPAAPK